MTHQLPKGAAAEEALRNYFLSIGYYVVRGSRFEFNQFHVTDIDLWLYARNSPMSRERICVDIKNKKTPQALERIFWAKGLQTVLNLDSCIVSTTDTRPDVSEFGLQHNVKVLDGKFLSRLTKSPRSYMEQRISEEMFLAAMDEGSMGRLSGDWRRRYEKSKARLLHSLDFDGCNAWLEEISYLFSQIASGIPTWRLFYASCSHLLIALDFILKNLVTVDQEGRRQALERGIRYGISGQNFTENVGRIAADLIESVTAQPGLSKTLQRELLAQATSVKADLLAEFFSRNFAGSGLFDAALAFERVAFAPLISTPSSMTTTLQSIIGVLADFCGIDRKIVLI